MSCSEDDYDRGFFSHGDLVVVGGNRSSISQDCAAVTRHSASLCGLCVVLLFVSLRPLLLLAPEIRHARPAGLRNAEP